MEQKGLLAKAELKVAAPQEKVWQALTDPALIRQYMFGTEVQSSWQQGAPIAWKGEWKGKTYEDKGMLLQIEPPRRLVYTHYSPLYGTPDVPESYHTVSVELQQQGENTRILLTQDNNPTQEAAAHSGKNWMMMLEGLKKLVEN